MSDLHDRLRRLGGNLDAAAAPVTPDEACRRAARGTVAAPARRAPWLTVSAAVVLVVALIAIGVGRRGPDTEVVTEPAASTTTPPSAPTTTESTTSTSDSTSDSAVDASLPGERVAIFPYQGARLAVVGVAATDTLNVRAGPGTEFDVRFTLGPLATDIRATGHNRSLGTAGFWSEIEAGGRTGWANSTFLLQPGDVDDITARLYPAPADRPRAETMLELGRVVAAREASEEPRSNVVVVDGPRVGSVGEITVDVIGLGDDSVGGIRLRVFAEPDPGGKSFTVRTVEATTLCSRGVSGGLCV
ncbi:MAG: hypothetical protein M3Q48_12045 [Actinomycetota bacterium]|nr:hypothetical protein [Actinomycetota bacterium]